MSTLNYALPDITLRLFTDEFELNKEYDAKFIDDFLDNVDDIKIALTAFNLSILETSILVVKNVQTVLKKKECSKLIFKREIINITADKKAKYFPLIGDLDKPYLLVPDKNKLSEDDYLQLSVARIKKPFTIIDSLDLSVILFKKRT